MSAIAFTDCETTGLDPIRHVMWEVAVVRREPGGAEVEHLWQRRLTETELEQADPKALEVNRYHERMVVPDSADAAVIGLDGEPVPVELDELVKQVHAALADAVMVGSNPAFDASFLRPMLGAAPWHYRTVDVATLAAGHLYAGRQIGEAAPSLPFSSRELSRAVGVEPPGDGVAHTALGDAKWAANVFDAVTGAVAR